MGIVGRTGAGKSSVINALFRLTPICNGWILVDGLNVANVAVGDLRRAFAVVPQSPFLFEGSLRLITLSSNQPMSFALYHLSVSVSPFLMLLLR